VRIIRISAGAVRQDATLNDTETARRIWDALPFEVAGTRWGDEIYFAIPVRPATEQGQEVVEPGDLGYWEPGSAFCIFWGPTPASRGDEVRPYSPVTVFGHLSGDPRAFDSFTSGTTVRVERLSDEDRGR
jgi:uncharacterized protein